MSPRKPCHSANTDSFFISSSKYEFTDIYLVAPQPQQEKRSSTVAPFHYSNK